MSDTFIRYFIAGFAGAAMAAWLGGCSIGVERVPDPQAGVVCYALESTTDIALSCVHVPGLSGAHGTDGGGGAGGSGGSR